MSEGNNFLIEELPSQHEENPETLGESSSHYRPVFTTKRSFASMSSDDENRPEDR